MPTVDAAAASGRKPMDWEAMHREQQRHITASMAEEFKRRDKIRRQHLEDALAAMHPSPRRAQPKRSPNCAPDCSACSRPLASTTKSRTPPHPCSRSLISTTRPMRDLAHNCFAALQLSGSAFEKDERESLARQWAAPGHAER
jgi:hypothetical protein